MANMIGYTHNQKIALMKRAKEIMATKDVRCDQGGCHTGHAEWCAVDEAYDCAVEQAKDEMAEKEGA